MTTTEIPVEVANLLKGPQLSIFAVADPAPTAGRPWGGRMGEDGRSVRVFFTEQWSGLVREGAPLAWTVCNPQTAETYQLKGKVRETVPPDAQDLEVYAAYRQGVIGYMRQNYGAPLDALEKMLSPPHKVAVLDVQAVYLQTPGPKAGSLIAGSIEEPSHAS